MRLSTFALCALALAAACDATGNDAGRTLLPLDASVDEADAASAPTSEQPGPVGIAEPSTLAQDGAAPLPDAAVDEPPADGLPCALAELLTSHCTRCHDGTGDKAPMALGTRSALLQPLPSAPTRTVAEEALLRMRSPTAPMPPEALLSNTQIVVLEDWLARGAPAEQCQDPGPPATPFEPSSLPSALSKVKLLLTGQAVTGAELNIAAASADGLRTLLDGWLLTPAFEQKLLAFFETAFQQSELTTSLLFDQLGSVVQGDAALLARLIENLEQSFARTALRIVKSGQPFNQTLTTQSFELTPALLSYLLLLDESPITDQGRRSPARVQFSVSTEGEPIDFAQSIDAASPNYLKFTAIGATAGCAETTRSSRSGAELFSLLLGRTPRTASCNPSRSMPIFTEQDFSSFRTVTLGKVAVGQPRLRFYDLPSLREAESLAVLVPRVGFFSTPAFFANYPTNDSNLMRVIANQTLIVALAASFDGTDPTPPRSTDGLNGAHSAPGSACYNCHKTLDPMRMFFRQAFTLGFSDQRDASLTNQVGSFTYAGEGVTGAGLRVLAEGLANHPRFARAWTHKLCHYANSEPCSDSDPELARVAAAFAASGLDFRVLVRELFSSPLVTYLAPTESATERGTHVGLARRNHFCHALATRLGLVDPCGQAAVPGRQAGQATAIAETIPEDSYSRGVEAPVTPSELSLFTRSAYESVCVLLAPQVLTGNAVSPLSSFDILDTLRKLRTTVMGLPDGDPRAVAAQAILREHYDTALAQGTSSLDALRSTFVLACTAPSSVSVGL